MATIAMLLLVTLSLPVAAAPVAPVLPNLPMPGYGPAADEPAPARRIAEIPTESQLLGDDSSQIDAVTETDEDLRDSVAELPSAGRLQAGLRAADLDTRLAAVRSAAGSRDGEAVPYLAAILMRIDEPASLRAAAALALGRIGKKAAVPALAEAIADPSPVIRYASALALGRLPARSAAAPLERVLRTDPAWQPRSAAIVALSHSGRASAAAALASALTDDAAWQVRRQAARSLQDMGASRHSAALIAALHDTDFSVRAAAGSALAQFGGSRNRRAVEDALNVEKEPWTRVVLTAALDRRARR